MKLSKIVLSLFSLFILFSCSNDDNVSDMDIIVGKWQVLEEYVNEELVEIPLCVPHYYYEYKEDGGITGGMVPNVPDNCLVLTFDFGFTWENLGGSRYQFNLEGDMTAVNIIYKEGANLVIERINDTKTVYKPYIEE